MSLITDKVFYNALRSNAALMEQVEHLQFSLSRNMNNTLFLTRLCACLRQAAGY